MTIKPTRSLSHRLLKAAVKLIFFFSLAYLVLINLMDIVPTKLVVYDKNNNEIGFVSIFQPTESEQSVTFAIVLLSGLQFWMLSVFEKEIDKKNSQI